MKYNKYFKNKILYEVKIINLLVCDLVGEMIFITDSSI